MIYCLMRRTIPFQIVCRVSEGHAKHSYDTCTCANTTMTGGVDTANTLLQEIGASRALIESRYTRMQHPRRNMWRMHGG